MSNRGPDGCLYITGHDLPQAYTWNSLRLVILCTWSPQKSLDKALLGITGQIAQPSLVSINTVIGTEMPTENEPRLAPKEPELFTIISLISTRNVNVEFDESVFQLSGSLIYTF